jgi:hypothetical protein
MIVRYQGGISEGDLGAICWFDLADTRASPQRTLRISEVIDIYIGKQTPVFMDSLAASVPLLFQPLLPMYLLINMFVIDR